ncbi:uncharacterized protein LOC123674042 [Harmonia axyridis]|uniref:uncharacterized protein LOC123674042 n=1 Tax=Harmonia axyridis TaxID=115357 RepID=UPI001E275B3C|nr:uncharacterized protein LOC123674042 [Harmonia axyridis]
MNLGCQSSYYNRMYKIVEESLDAALYVCNNNMERFTDAKIFDVFDQTFPTAFILSTGYWIFFVSNYGAPLCVCGRFGVVCRHVRHRTHWIDLQPMAEKSESIVFAPKIYGAVIPRKYNIAIDSATECNGYVISINMDLIYSKKVRKEFHVNIRASYGYVYPCYGALFSVRFTPNPILKGNYGKYLEQLKIHRAVLVNRHYVDDLIVTPYSMPSTCLLLISVNLIKYDLPGKISAVPLSEWEISRNDFRCKDASTQTIHNNELELYKKALENFSNSIWHYKEDTDNDSRILSQFLSDNEQEKSGKSFPLGIDNPEQYDRQFPDMTNKTNGKLSKHPIREDSIPKPILAPSIQVNINQSKCQNFQGFGKAQLPNFEEAFQTCQYFAKPQSTRRKRGRPKAFRYDVSRSLNAVLNTKKPVVATTIASISPPSSENLTTESSIEQVHSSSEEEKPVKVVDSQSLAEFDEIVKQVNEKCKYFGDEDYENELDLINQLITEKMQNDMIGIYGEKSDIF